MMMVVMMAVVMKLIMMTPTLCTSLLNQVMCYVLYMHYKYNLS